MEPILGKHSTTKLHPHPSLTILKEKMLKRGNQRGNLRAPPFLVAILTFIFLNQFITDEGSLLCILGPMEKEQWDDTLLLIYIYIW